MKDLIGRRFEFKRVDGRIVPVRELPSETWFHADGTVQPVIESSGNRIKKIGRGDNQTKVED